MRVFGRKISLFVVWAVLSLVVLPAFATVYRPGLVQAKLTGTDITATGQCTKYPSNLLATVSATNLDRTLDTMMANFTAADSSTSCSNAVSGLKWNWNDFTTFAYEGEIWLQADATYNMFEQGDDGAAIVVEGAIITTAGTTSRWQGGTGASFAPVKTGWHRFNA